MKAPSNDRLEALEGDRPGQRSIRIDDRRRVRLIWTDVGPSGVDIVDYHDG